MVRRPGFDARPPQDSGARGEPRRAPWVRARSERTTRIPVALPEQSQPEHWLRSFRLSGFTLMILGLVILMVIVLAPSLRILVEQQQTIAQLRQDLEDQQQSVDELEGDVARWSDPAYIEAQARERLLYAYPGEYSYLVIDDAGLPVSSDRPPISDEIQTTRVDWVQSLLSSVFTAALTDAPAAELETPPAEETPAQ